MKKPLVIYGAGGLGREILALVRILDAWKLLGFIDDGCEAGKLINGLPVLGGISFLNNMTSVVEVVLAVGDPKIKLKLAADLNRPNIHFPTVIDPSVRLLDPATIRIGKGSVIGAGTILTTGIEIGNHVLINLNCTVGHDVRIGDFSSVMPGVNLAGAVVLEPRVLIGSGANIRNQIVVGEGSRVGMGAVVIRDVPSETIVVGVPAKPL